MHQSWIPVLFTKKPLAEYYIAILPIVLFSISFFNIVIDESHLFSQDSEKYGGYEKQHALSQNIKIWNKPFINDSMLRKLFIESSFSP